MRLIIRRHNRLIATNEEVEVISAPTMWRYLHLSALDPHTERQILEEMQQTQTSKTLIWATHHEVVKEYASHVVRVDNTIMF